MPPKKVCGNPLFLSWMEGLRDEARAKGHKVVEAYAKACKSLAACPVRYERPRELLVLQGIGPKTVGILETKWAAYCAENGLPAPGTPQKSKGKARAASPPPTEGNDDSEDREQPAKPPPKKRKTAATPRVYVPAINSGGYGILMSLVLAIDQPTRNTQVFLTKSEVIRGARPFCDTDYDHPEKGTYFTAWNSMKTLVNKGYVYMTGNPQKFCLTEDGYDVACSIRALRPEFVHIDKHPFLHEPVEDNIAADRARGPAAARLRVRSPVSRLLTPAPSVIQPIAAATDPTAGSGKQGHRGSSRFHFWYVDSSSQRVHALSSAMIRLDPDDFINLRKVEFRAYQRDHAFAKQLRMVDTVPRLRDTSGLATVFAFVMEDAAPPLCSKFDDEADQSARMEDIRRTEVPLPLSPPESVPTLPKRPAKTINAPGNVSRRGMANEPIVLDSDSDDDFEFLDASHASSSRGLMRSTASMRAAEATTAITTDTSIASCSARGLSPLRSRLDLDEALSTSQAGTSVSTSRTPASQRTRSGPRLSAHVPARNPLLDADEPDVPVNLPDFDPSSAIIFPAGTFEVILILDSREVESRTNRDKIAEALEAKGVKVETRALRLGDMCWIARRLDGIGDEEDECILDYVVERKRLDDLCHSIRDGRYTEQCFRLSNSAISHVYYIVEDWQVTERMAHEGLQIMTAKSQIQVHNGFFLKETHRLAETIDYLTTMTKVITAQHASQDLRVIPTRYLSRSTYGALQAHLRRTRGPMGEAYLTSFQAYQDLNDKSASKTLRERFGRMLFCIKGMSAERVAACLDVWETPHALWVDLRDAEKEWQRKKREAASLGDVPATSGRKKSKPKERGPDMFFADRVKGEGRRKIGDALSRVMYRAFMGSPSVEESTSD